jgi:hypothetical protein
MSLFVLLLIWQYVLNRRFRSPDNVPIRHSKASQNSPDLNWWLSNASGWITVMTLHIVITLILILNENNQLRLAESVWTW